MDDNIPLSKLLNCSLPLFKLCRLCGSKNGPFLNIFGTGVELAKKIKNALFIRVAESDDLPHDVCFRCSVKVEDYHEFLEKCIETQEKLSQMLGKDFNYKRDKSKQIKSKGKEKLNKSKYRHIEEKKFIKLSPSGAPISYRSNQKLRKLKIKMIRVDKPDFPGVEKRNGKYFIMDIKKPSTLETLISGRRKAGPKRYKDNADANINFDLLQNSLKNRQTQNVKNRINAKNTEKLQTQNVRQYTDFKNTFPVAKETQSSESTKPIKPANTQIDERPIPGNFSTIKVAEIGAVVYTCKLCHHSILEKDKIFNHKCFIPRSNRYVRANKPYLSVENNHTETANTVSLHDNTPCENTSGPIDQDSDRSSHSKRKNGSTTKRNLTNISNINNLVPELGLGGGTVAIGSQITPSITLSNSDIYTPQLSQSLSMAPGMGPNMDASILPKSFFMPMGDHSYSLQLRNLMNQPAPPPPATSIPVNHLTTSSSSYANHQFPTSLPSYSNQQFTTSSPPYINQQFTIAQSCIPTEHSILPDCNRTISVMSLPASVKTSAAQQKSTDKLIIKNLLSNYTNKKNSSNPKQVKSSRKVNVNKALGVHYAIGLLCKNSSNQENSANANRHALPREKISYKPPVAKGHKKDIPKHTILSTKTPRKVIISRILNKPIKTAPKLPVKVQKKRARKQNLERKTEQETLSVEFEKESNQEPVEEKYAHLYQYINLDPMLQSSPYTPPNPNAVQEAEITTVEPVTFKLPSRSRVEAPNKGSIEIGNCDPFGFCSYLSSPHIVLDQA